MLNSSLNQQFAIDTSQRFINVTEFPCTRYSESESSQTEVRSRRIGATVIGVVLVVLHFRDLAVFLSSPFLGLP